jgi:hypothetical protein
MRKVQQNRKGLELHRIHQLVVYAEVNLLDENINIIKEDAVIRLQHEIII